MKRVLLVALLITVCPAHTSAKVRAKSPRLQATAAALVVQSFQLGEKSQQLFSIKDSLLAIVKAEAGNLSSRADFIVDAAMELKYIATVAYFEGNLLGAVLALREEFQSQYISNRILEFENAINNTISSLRPLQVAVAAIKNSEALPQIEQSIQVTQSLLEIYRNSIEILQKMVENKTGEQEQIQQ